MYFTYFVSNCPAVTAELDQTLHEKNSRTVWNYNQKIIDTILSWRIPWAEEPVGYSPWGCKESDVTEQLTLSSFHNKVFA